MKLIIEGTEKEIKKTLQDIVGSKERENKNTDITSREIAKTLNTRGPIDLSWFNQSD